MIEACVVPRSEILYWATADPYFSFVRLTWSLLDFVMNANYSAEDE